MSRWDEQYKAGEGLRWWPETELVRFIGRVYGWTHGKAQVDSPLKALDLGCGTGRNSWLLYEAGFQVLGIDGSQEAVECSREYIDLQRFPHGSSIFFRQCNLPGLDKAMIYPESYDLVIDCQTIQHLNHIEHIMAYAEIAVALKSGGRFWSMHYDSGDAAEIFPDHPELQEWNYDRLGAMLVAAKLQQGESELLMRSYRGAKKKIFWHIMEWVKR